jgi:hypothetical protein
MGTRMNSVHLPHLEFENCKVHNLIFFTILGKNDFTSDSQGHYDMDGVSLDSDGVIVASDANGMKTFLVILKLQFQKLHQYLQ